MLKWTWLCSPCWLSSLYRFLQIEVCDLSSFLSICSLIICFFGIVLLSYYLIVNLLFAFVISNSNLELVNYGIFGTHVHSPKMGIADFSTLTLCLIVIAIYDFCVLAVKITWMILMFLWVVEYECGWWCFFFYHYSQEVRRFY